MKEGANSFSFKPALFVGVLLSEPLKVQIFEQDPLFTRQFIGDEEPKLYRFENEGATYLGKYLKLPSNCQKLQFLEENVRTLLAKVAPSERQSHKILAIPTTLSK